MNSEGADDLAKRIRYCAEAVGSGDQLSRISAIPRRTLESYMTGETEPRAGRLAVIAEVSGVDPGWLLTGAGSPRKPEPASPQPAPRAGVDEELLVSIVRVIDQYIREHRLAPSSEKKARLIAALYDDEIERRGREERAPVDQARVLRFLRLVG